jgi:hypothetical protein
MQHQQCVLTACQSATCGAAPRPPPPEWHGPRHHGTVHSAGGGGAGAAWAGTLLTVLFTRLTPGSHPITHMRRAPNACARPRPPPQGRGRRCMVVHSHNQLLAPGVPPAHLALAPQPQPGAPTWPTCRACAHLAHMQGVHPPGPHAGRAPAQSRPPCSGRAGGARAPNAAGCCPPAAQQPDSQPARQTCQSAVRSQGRLCPAEPSQRIMPAGRAQCTVGPERTEQPHACCTLRRLHAAPADESKAALPLGVHAASLEREPQWQRGAGTACAAPGSGPTQPGEGLQWVCFLGRGSSKAAPTCVRRGQLEAQLARTLRSPCTTPRWCR